MKKSAPEICKRAGVRQTVGEILASLKSMANSPLT